MKKLIFTFLFFTSFFGIAQTVGTSADCPIAENLCSDAGVSFPLATGSGSINDLPSWLTISNPGFGQGPNNGNPNSSGCLNSDELNPNWFLINISNSGVLEFTISGPGGLYDWAMWPYYENGDGTTACNDITNNLLAPVACNWNAASDGFTGMYQQGALPAGANQGNFEYALNVNGGDQFILCFSNYSFTSGTAQIQFGNDIPGNNNPNSAGITCDAVTGDVTICLGDVATINVNINPQIVNPSVVWLNTNGVSDINGINDVEVNISSTDTYQVQILENGNPIDTSEFTITVVAPPTPNAGVDDIICIGETIPLDGNPSDPMNNFEWTHDTEGITPSPIVNYSPNNTNESPVVTVNQAGLYTFILTEDNEVCPPVSDEVEVLVSSTSHTTTWIGPSCAGMSNGSITINNPDAVTYSFDNGSTWITDATETGFPVGSYQVVSRNQYGCEFTSTVVITEPDQLYIFAGNDTLVCQNGTANLWASTSAPELDVEYVWSHSSSIDSIVTFSPTVNTTIEVYAQGPSGCVSDTAQILVNVRTPISANISEFDTICPGYPTNIFVNNVSGGIGVPYTIEWSTGEIGTGSMSEIEVTPDVQTVYYATITDECESSPFILQTQVSLSPLPVPQFSVVDNALCEPAIFELVNETDTLLTQTYTWVFEDGESYQDISPIITEEFSHGMYDVQLIVTSPFGCIDSITYYDFLTSYQTPEANFSWSPNPVQQFNTEVNFSNQSFLEVENYWTFEQGVPPSSNQETPSTTFPDGIEGEYNVTLIVVSEQGCIDTLTRLLTVFPEVLFYAPNTFTPDGDEFNQTWGVVIDGIDFSSFNLTIYNRWGEQIWESNDANAKWDGTYNGRIVPAGTYTWVLKVKDALSDSKYIWNGYINLLK